MRASIRRIDLTQSPATVDAWPKGEWLSPEPAASTPSTSIGPRGRGGLWAAMASAVARAREASTAGETGLVEPSAGSADVIDLVAEAPHLAYLARVACTAEREEPDEMVGFAEIIDFDASRSRDLR
jgi:hypothetical protein